MHEYLPLHRGGPFESGPPQSSPVPRFQPGDRRRGHQVLVVALALLGCLLAAGVAQAKKVGPTQLIRAQTEVPEELLLDVGIVVFEPGLPPGDENALEDEGVYADIRKSEARYLPVQLMDTLQSTGLWGAVRVIPKDTRTVDVVIRGQIVESSGMRLELELEALDSSGRAWFETRWKSKADHTFYREGADQAPFQDLFETVANELYEARRKLDDEEILELRRITAMRFAEDLSPDAFDGYLGADRRGRLEVRRLPAEGDPMIARVDRIRERDHLLVDTLTQHYTNFSAQVAESYEHWRRYSFEEELAQKKVKKQARTRTLLGALAILGAVATSGDSSTNGVRDLAIYGGLQAVQSGMNKAQEAKMHRTALRELAVSFDSEVAPMLVEVEGETLELTGSAEAQFEEWRHLLRKMFQEELGLPLDPDTGEPIDAVVYQTASEPVADGLELSDSPRHGPLARPAGWQAEPWTETPRTVLPLPDGARSPQSLHPPQPPHSPQPPEGPHSP